MYEKEKTAGYYLKKMLEREKAGKEAGEIKDLFMQQSLKQLDGYCDSFSVGREKEVNDG